MLRPIGGKSCVSRPRVRGRHKISVCCNHRSRVCWRKEISESALSRDRIRWWSRCRFKVDPERFSTRFLPSVPLLRPPVRLVTPDAPRNLTDSQCVASWVYCCMTPPLMQLPKSARVFLYCSTAVRMRAASSPAVRKAVCTNAKQMEWFGMYSMTRPLEGLLVGWALGTVRSPSPTKLLHV